MTSVYHVIPKRSEESHKSLIPHSLRFFAPLRKTKLQNKKLLRVSSYEFRYFFTLTEFQLKFISKFLKVEHKRLVNHLQ